MQEELHRLRPNAGNLQHLPDIRGHLLFQVFIVSQPAGGHQVPDLGRQGAADARDLLQAAFPDQVLDVEAGVLQHPGRVPVGPGLEGVLAQYFEEFCNLVENPADFLVSHAALTPRSLD